MKHIITLVFTLLISNIFYSQDNEGMYKYQKEFKVEVEKDSEKKVIQRKFDFYTKYKYIRDINSNYYKTDTTNLTFFFNKENTYILRKLDNEKSGVILDYVNMDSDTPIIEVDIIDNLNNDPKNFNYFRIDERSKEFLKKRKKDGTLKKLYKNYTSQKTENENEIIYRYDIITPVGKQKLSTAIVLTIAKDNTIKFSNNMIWWLDDFFNLNNITFETGVLKRFEFYNYKGVLEKLFELKETNNKELELSISRGAYGW